MLTQSDWWKIEQPVSYIAQNQLRIMKNVFYIGLPGSQFKLLWWVSFMNCLDCFVLSHQYQLDQYEPSNPSFKVFHAKPCRKCFKQRISCIFSKNHTYLPTLGVIMCGIINWVKNNCTLGSRNGWPHFWYT